MALGSPVGEGTTGTRYFWTNTLGTIYVSQADDFAAVDLTTAEPGAGVVLQ